jgi:hypothetical protein
MRDTKDKLSNLKDSKNSNSNVGGFCVKIGLIFLSLMGIGKALTLVLKLSILA